MTTYDPKKIRVRKDWALVLDDDRKMILASGIILPGHETGMEKVTEWKGTLVAVGEGYKTKVGKLAPGVTVVYRAFLKHANRVPTDEFWESGAEKHYFIMSIDDIIGVVAPGVDVGVYSSSKEKKE